MPFIVPLIPLLDKTPRRALVWILCAVLCGLAACSSQKTQPNEPLADAPNAGPHAILQGNYPPLEWPGASAVRGAVPGWQLHTFPSKRTTQYTAVEMHGRRALMARAQSSASMVRQLLRVEPRDLGYIRFSWFVPELIPGADLLQRDAHDSPVRLVLIFDGDRSGFSMKNAMLSELSRTLTGEELPYATLMYVWCNNCAAETIFTSPRTDRIREIALQTGPAGLNRWLDYQRDIGSDYQKAFGQAPGALLGVGIMTDTDNTRQNTLAWYGAVSLTQ